MFPLEIVGQTRTLGEPMKRFLLKLHFKLGSFKVSFKVERL
jgi:hypothetical protein